MESKHQLTTKLQGIRQIIWWPVHKKHHPNTIASLIMNADNNTQQATTNANTAPTTSTTPDTATPLQIGMGLIILGASAGLTLYTKKTQSLLSQMKRADQNKAMRLPKKKFGPMTKPEWEQMRSRWTQDDLWEGIILSRAGRELETESSCLQLERMEGNINVATSFQDGKINLTLYLAWHKLGKKNALLTHA